MREVSEEDKLIFLLALHDISGGDTGAEIPEGEILSYVNDNLDDLTKRVRSSNQTAKASEDG